MSARDPAIETLRIIDRKTLLKLLPVSRATLHRLEARGDFPAAIKLSRSKVGYRLSAVEAFLESRSAKAVRRGDPK